MTPATVTPPSAVEAAVAAPATAATPSALAAPATAVAATAPTVAAAAARALGNQAGPAVRPDSVKAGYRRCGSRCGRGLRHGSATEEQRAGHGAGTQRTCGRAA
jgi:hypothetical protein